MADIKTACFVIADISGYTNYLSGVELDHAQDILADVIDTVATALRPPFHLAKLEGDAVFVYSITDTIEASLLEDTIETTYFAFRRRVRDMKHLTACSCDACRHIGDLDLKFVVHHGEMAVQSMAGREELVGRDVILVHRLLKSAASELTGGGAYALYSRACIDTMNIDPERHGMVPLTESFEGVGETTLWVSDLEKAWTDHNARNPVYVEQDDASITGTVEIDAPRSLVWEYLTLPGHRMKWQGVTGVDEDLDGGRRDVGVVAHCAHGDFVVREQLLD